MLLLFKMFIGAIATMLALFSLFELGIRYLQDALVSWHSLRAFVQLCLFSYLAWYLSPTQVRKRHL